MLNKKFAERLILLIGLLSLAFFVNLRYLKLDYRFENFFPAKDPDLNFYYDFVKEFETDNDFFIIGVKNEKGIFKQDFLTKVDALTDSIQKIKNVAEVTSPTKLKFPVVGPIGVISVPYLHVNRPELYQKDSIRIYESQNLVGSLFSEDAKTLSLQVKHLPNLAKSPSDSLVLAIENTLQSFGFDEAHAAGKIKGQYYFTQQMVFELLLFIGVSIGLVAIFLFISFRAFWGIWVPLIVIGLSVLWMLSIMGIIDKPINLMTTLLPTILFVVGISNVVHLLERYIYELRNGKTKKEAIKTSFKEVGFATFLTSFTTAVGFFTLNTINIVPVKEFGTYTAIGVLISFLLAFSLLPSVLVITKKPKIAAQSNDGHFWTLVLHRLLMWILPNRKIVGFILLGLIGISAAGISMLKVDNFFVEDWTINEETKNDYLFFEKELSGFRPFELAVFSKDSNQTFNDYNLLVQLDSIESALHKTYQTNFIVSPLNFVKTANQSLHGGKTEFYALPSSEKEYKKLKAKFRNYKASGLNTYLNEKATKARFSSKVIDYGGHQMNLLNDEFFEKINKTIDTETIDVQITGMPYLVDKNNKNLSKNLLFGLSIAFAIVALLMAILYRSVPMIIVALIPNILPLALIAALMGFLGIDLKIATSIVFTIAFGIAVDDTIHFLSKYKIELRKHRSRLYALKRTYLQTGKAIVVTSLILSAGFLILILSQVTSTFYIGFLISLTLIFALISNLFLLPVLILFFYMPKRKKLPLA